MRSARMSLIKMCVRARKLLRFAADATARKVSRRHPRGRRTALRANHHLIHAHTYTHTTQQNQHTRTLIRPRKYSQIAGAVLFLPKVRRRRPSPPVFKTLHHALAFEFLIYRRFARVCDIPFGVAGAATLCDVDGDDDKDDEYDEDEDDDATSLTTMICRKRAPVQMT